MIKLNYTNNVGRKRVYLLHLTTCSPSIWEVTVGTQGRNLEAETEVEAVEGHCLLACSSCFLVAPRTANPGVALPTGSWVLPHQLSIRECITSFPAGQAGGGIFSAEGPSSETTNTCQHLEPASSLQEFHLCLPRARILDGCQPACPIWTSDLCSSCFTC